MRRCRSLQRTDLEIGGAVDEKTVVVVMVERCRSG
jgi:hypothetical protein